MLLFFHIYYVSTGASYVKKTSEVILFFRTVVMFVIVELQVWNAILLKCTVI